MRIEIDAGEYYKFYYQSNETPERISPEKLKTMFEQHDKVAGELLPNSGRQNISKVLGIHHPVLDDPMQQEFFYRLSEVECERSEQLLCDLIRHSNKIILILAPYGEGYKPEATVLPTKETRRVLADVFSLSGHKMNIPPQTVFTDWPCRTVLLFPSGVKFFFFDRKECFISTRDSSQRLEGTIGQEFIDACFALLPDAETVLHEAGGKIGEELN
ncbi:MAG: hypothetical protein FWC50_15875 [Planctomycetaceae bacterium]|nr:hypothetical protein [Planctomycetaceae bacterium]